MSYGSRLALDEIYLYTKMTVAILLIVAVILVCTLFIIYALNQVADTNDKLKYMEQIISSIDDSVKKPDRKWYIDIDAKMNKLRRAATYQEGDVDLELKSMIRELTIWMLSRKS